MEECLLVYMTTPDSATARKIAAVLVRERLAACANILDAAESLYWWEGAVQQASGSLCILKTTAGGYPALEKRARELHPYDVPCIVALHLTEGHAPFLRWIARETGGTSTET